MIGAMEPATTTRFGSCSEKSSAISI